MRNPLAVGAATLAIVLSLGLAACGSDDDSGDAPSEDALTKTELVAEADAICTETNSELITKANDLLKPDSTQEDAEAFVNDEVVPLYETQIEKLRALEPDDESSDSYTEMIDTLESELQVIADDPSVMATQGSAFPEATSMAKEFGLKVCGSGGGS